MVVAVVLGPPERALLHGGRSGERPEETRHAVHLERTVREVPVERQGEADGSQEMRYGPQRDEWPREWDEEDEQQDRRAL